MCRARIVGCSRPNVVREREIYDGNTIALAGRSRSHKRENMTREDKARESRDGRDREGGGRRESQKCVEAK